MIKRLKINFEKRRLVRDYELSLERAEKLAGTVHYSDALADLGSIEMKLGRYERAAEIFDAAANAARGWAATRDISAKIYDEFADFAREKAKEEKEKLNVPNNFSLEADVSFVVALSGFVLSFLFLAPHFTGFVVSYSFEGVLDFIGAASFIVGVIGAFVFVRKRRSASKNMF